MGLFLHWKGHAFSIQTRLVKAVVAEKTLLFVERIATHASRVCRVHTALFAAIFVVEVVTELTYLTIGLFQLGITVAVVIVFLELIGVLNALGLGHVQYETL